MNKKNLTTKQKKERLATTLLAFSFTALWIIAHNVMV